MKVKNSKTARDAAPPCPKSEVPNRVTVGRPFQWLEDMFKNYRRPADDKRKFDFLCVVAGRINSPGPRDKRWEYILDFGSALIPKVLKRQAIGPGPHVFIFPDRWMVPGESVEFGHALSENPDAHRFKQVYVVTHAPYIVGDCLREQVVILTKD